MKEYSATEIQMDSYSKALKMTEKDINKEFTRVKKFVLESQYPDLTPDRDSDWHNSDHCEMTDCTVTAWTTFTRRHHCRMCARSVCGNHSRQKKDIRAWDLKHVRVCDPCAEGLNRGGVLYHELELDPGTEAFKKLFTSRSIEEWKDLIEYLGLEWERKVELDIVALRTQHAEMKVYEENIRGMQTALAAGKMELQRESIETKTEVPVEIQTYATDEERQAAVYGKPGQRTEKGKELDGVANQLRDNMTKMVERSQSINKLCDDTEELKHASKQFADRARRIKEKLAAKNSFERFFM